MPIWTQWWAWCQMLHQALILSHLKKLEKRRWANSANGQIASRSSDPIGNGNRKRISKILVTSNNIGDPIGCIGWVSMAFPDAFSCHRFTHCQTMRDWFRDDEKPPPWASKSILEIDLNCAKLLASRLIKVGASWYCFNAVLTGVPRGIPKLTHMARAPTLPGPCLLGQEPAEVC